MCVCVCVIGETCQLTLISFLSFLFSFLLSSLSSFALSSSHLFFFSSPLLLSSLLLSTLPLHSAAFCTASLIMSNEHHKRYEGVAPHAAHPTHTTVPFAVKRVHTHTHNITRAYFSSHTISRDVSSRSECSE